MKNALSFVLALVLLISLSAAASAETPYAEILGDIVRLRDDGSEQSYFDETFDIGLVCNTDGIGCTVKQGPILTSIDGVFVCSLTVHDDLQSRALYGVEGDTPFTLIRLTYTVENTGEKAVQFPGPKFWIVTSMGEIVQGRVSGRSGDEDIPKTLEAGEALTRYLFFVCPETIPEAISFFTLVIPEPWQVNGSAYGITRGLCFELLETAV